MSEQTAVQPITRNVMKISIIVTAHNNGEELERNLPQFFAQEYADDFEVIVVVEKGEDDTDDALTRLKTQYPQLYSTYVPESSRYVSRKKLAVTLGVPHRSHLPTIVNPLAYDNGCNRGGER